MISALGIIFITSAIFATSVPFNTSDIVQRNKLTDKAISYIKYYGVASIGKQRYRAQH